MKTIEKLDKEILTSKTIKLFLVLVISILLISFLVIIMTVIILYRNNHIFWGDIDFQKIYSIGTFIGGVLGPLLTFASVCFLGVNYFTNEKKKIIEKQEIIKKELGSEKLRQVELWKEHTRLMIDKLSNKKRNFDIILNKKQRFYNVDSDIRKDDQDQITQFYRWLKHGTIKRGEKSVETYLESMSWLYSDYTYCLAEIDSCPETDDNKRLKYKMNMINYLITTFPFGTLSYILSYIVYCIVNTDIVPNNFEYFIKYNHRVVFEGMAKEIGYEEEWKEMNDIFKDYKNKKYWVDNNSKTYETIMNELMN